MTSAFVESPDHYWQPMARVGDRSLSISLAVSKHPQNTPDVDRLIVGHKLE
jgi:hypothetical protein